MKSNTSYLCLILVLFFGILTHSPAVAQDPLDVRAAFAQALEEHDTDKILSLFTEDGVFDLAVLTAPLMDTPEKIVAFFADQFSGSPDWHTTEGRVLVVGNTVVVEHAAAGTNTGESSLPVSGNPWIFPHLDIYEIQGDKIRRLTTYADYAGTMVQLGLAPVPAPADLTPSVTPADPESTGLSPLEADAENLRRFNSQDLDLQAKMMHADAEIFVAPLGMSLDRASALAMNEKYYQGFSDVHMESVRQIDLGDGWIVMEATSQGTHDGPFFGMPPTGAPVQMRVALLTHYDATGLITYQGQYYDMMTLTAQITPPAQILPPVSALLVQDEITSPSLAGNLLGDPATRPVLVYLPPSYESSPESRYPTVYLLHGFDTNHLCYDASGVNFATQFLTGIDLGVDVGSIVEDMMVAGQLEEFIVVMPNAANSMAGSLYERSPLIGDYRDYIAKDLVDYIDGKYRTIPESRARGIAGQSMGGYGALSLTLEYPDVFGPVAALSPALCEMEVDDAIDDYLAKYPMVLGMPMPGYEAADMWNVFLGYFEVNWLYAIAAAWTPNLENPPFYVDLPVQYPGPVMDPDIMDQWKERDLVSQVERLGANLKGKPLFVDEGRGPTMLMEEVLGVDRLLSALHSQGLSYTYDAFDGDHLTGFRHQIVSALSFMSLHLDAQVGE